MSSADKKICLICKEQIPSNGLLNHIADHLKYKRHTCTRCTFKSVTGESLMDHQNITGHKVEVDGNKNWYMERICQLIYHDFNYAEKHGEEAIRKSGSTFADRDRLLEMLKDEQVKEENYVVTIDSDEYDQQMEMHQPGEMLPTPRPTNPTPNTAKRFDSNMTSSSESSGQHLLDPNPGTSQLRRRSTTPKRVHFDGDHSPGQQTAQRQEQGMEVSQNLANRNPRRRSNTVQTAAADSSISVENNPKNSTTERVLAEIHRQITKGVEKKKCKMCTQQIPNDYASQKKHIFEKHMSAVPFSERFNFYRYGPVLVRCFKEEGYLQITNDLQCNICGREFRNRGGRYGHVATHTDYRWKCIFSGCDSEICSFPSFVSHMNQIHGKRSTELEKDDKDHYTEFKAEFELKMTPLVRKCFPFDLPKITPGGRSADEDAMIDQITCDIMPSRVIPQRLAPRIRQPNNSDVSDPSTDEDTKPPDAKIPATGTGHQQLHPKGPTNKPNADGQDQADLDLRDQNQGRFRSNSVNYRRNFHHRRSRPNFGNNYNHRPFYKRRFGYEHQEL